MTRDELVDAMARAEAAKFKDWNDENRDDAASLRFFLEKAHKDRDRLKIERDAALGILRVIHRDGGHYIQEHGIAKSAADAHLAWASLMERAEERDNLSARVAALEAELAGRRMCLNCGRYAPQGHDRSQPLPECVGEGGLAGCAFDMTPDEAVNHWRRVAHERYVRVVRLEEALRPFAEAANATAAIAPQLEGWSIGGSTITFGDLRRARAAIEEVK
jgi:hypothetical protein